MRAQKINKACIKYDENEHSDQKVKLDAMFFAATEETLDLEHKDDSKVEYLNYDTFILCNPNAMAYQNMINYPHAYYLKFFLHRHINCFVWNYRGYGRTKGNSEPHLFKQDAE